MEEPKSLLALIFLFVGFQILHFTFTKKTELFLFTFSRSQFGQPMRINENRAPFDVVNQNNLIESRDSAATERSASLALCLFSSSEIPKFDVES